MQSVVLTCWELVSKVSSHHLQLPRNLRTSFLLRRTVHHSVGYASLFGTYEATRRLLLHATDVIVFRQSTWKRTVFSSTTTGMNDDDLKQQNDESWLYKRSIVTWDCLYRGWDCWTSASIGQFRHDAMEITIATTTTTTSSFLSRSYVSLHYEAIYLPLFQRHSALWHFSTAET